MITALIGFACLLGLVFVRVPIALALAVVGAVGFSLLTSERAALSMIASVAQEAGFNYLLSVIPLFVLMGNVISRTGMAEELFEAAYAFLGHRPGGLAMSTIVACGGFSAMCGSSLATAATMSRVAMPSMQKYKYADSLSSGAIAAGGTLGILIPPSVLLIIYGILTQTNIAALFAAGLVPGILGVLFYLAAVRFTVFRDPAKGPRGERVEWRARISALKGIWSVAVLFTIVIGGIYGGVFTPTEAAGVGAAGAFGIAALRRRISVEMLRATLRETVTTTAMIFTVLIGTLIFANFINLSGLARDLLGWLEALDVSPAVVLLGIVVIYLILGCVLESLSMVLLTVPIFYPVVDALGFDLIWFGIIVVVVTEISLITPPIGMNIFVLRSVVKDVSTATIFRGVTPFWIADILRLAALLIFPALSLFLPSLLF